MTMDERKDENLRDESRWVLDLLLRIEHARTRDDLSLALVTLRGALQTRFDHLREAGVIDASSDARAPHEAVLRAVNDEIVSLQAEIDGEWREHRAARDALLRAARAQERRYLEALGT